MGCHFLFQGVFLTQRLNLHLLNWQLDSLPLCHLGSLYIYICVCVCVCVCIFFFFFRLFSLIGYYKISRSLFVDFFLIPEMSLNQAPYSCRDSPASSLLLIPLLAWPSNWFVCHLQTLSMDPAPATGVFREPLCMVVSPLCSQISGPSLGLRIPQSIELVSRLEPALPHE